MSFYTYIHRRESDGFVFYVGKGRERRAYQFQHRNSHWTNTMKKHGVIVDIVANWATEEEAFSHERLLIACLKDLGHPLTNMTDGGEGTSGHKPNAEQRLRNAAAQRRPEVAARKAAATRERFSKDPLFAEFNRRRKIEAQSDPSVRARMSASARIKIFTPEHRSAMSRAKIGNRIKAPKAVMLLGYGIEFRAIVDAIEWLREGGFRRADAGSITKVCKGTSLTHQGFHWSYRNGGES